MRKVWELMTPEKVTTVIIVFTDLEEANKAVELSATTDMQ